MKVDFYSTSGMPKSLRNDFVRVFRKSLDRESLIEGSACRGFEQKFGDYLGVNHVIGVGNGFDAIKIGLQSMGIGPGDRVAVPAHTFIATWFAITAIGAIPIGIDVTQEGQIDLDQLEMEVGIKAVIPVHMHGTHCDMKRLTTWAQPRGIKILEDCAQAAGLDIQGKKAGAWGDVAAFSFYPTKNLFSLGDSGAIATKSPSIREKARALTRYGADKDNKYLHTSFGQNSRLDTIQAGFLNHALDFLDEWNENRRQIASWYDDAFAAFKVTPTFTFRSIYHHYFLMLKDRDTIKNELSNIGIGAEIHYPNVAGIEAGGGNLSDFPVSVKIARHTLSLPISPWQNLKQTTYVIKCLSDILKRSI
jgi:dTDP-4-amino-4,6-dideoxygalactose transaminase